MLSWWVDTSKAWTTCHLGPVCLLHWGLCLLFPALILQTSVLRVVYLAPHFPPSPFVCFCWWFTGLNAPRHDAAVMSCLPKHKKPVMCLGRKYMGSISFAQVWFLRLSVMSSMLMDRQYTLNQVFWDTNIHKTRLRTDQPMNVSWPQAHRNLTLHLP